MLQISFFHRRSLSQFVSQYSVPLILGSAFAVPAFAQGPMSNLSPDSGLANQPATTSPYSTTQPWVTPVTPYYQNQNGIASPGVPSTSYPSTSLPSASDLNRDMNSGNSISTQQGQVIGTQPAATQPAASAPGVSTQPSNQMNTQGGTSMGTQSGSTTSAGGQTGR